MNKCKNAVFKSFKSGFLPSRTLPNVSILQFCFVFYKAFSCGFYLETTRAILLMFKLSWTGSACTMSFGFTFLNIHFSRQHVKQPNLKTRPLVISVSNTTINKNNSASSTTRWRQRSYQCSPLQHIRGVPTIVALKVPIYKVIGLRVFNSGREADLKPPLLPSTWTVAD